MAKNSATNAAPLGLLGLMAYATYGLTNLATLREWPSAMGWVDTAWGVFIAWVISDARRIGLGTGWGVGFALLSGLGTCFAFPLYLVKRERFLDAKAQPG